MDFSNIKVYLKDKMERFKFSNLKEQFIKKHALRLRVYETMLDYMNSPSTKGDLGYFSWYTDQLDRRSNKSPLLARVYYSATKTKNDQSFRNFLNHCMTKVSVGDDMKTVLRDFMPDDEYNLYLSNTSSDQKPIITGLMTVCKDKMETSKMITSIISSNLFIIVFSGIVHTVLFNALYLSFLSGEIIYTDNVPDRDLTPLEQNYYRYMVIINYWYLFIGGTISFALFLKWSVKNWCNKGIQLREELFDFLPPYSINKVKTQYEIVMMIYYNLSSGKKWLESLELIKRLSSPYAKYQIDKIIRRTPNNKPNEALNIFYMGAAGDYIDSRSAGRNFVEVLEESVVTLQIAKMALIEKITDRIKKFVILPVVWGGIAFSAIPVFMHILSLASEAQSAGGG
jgi:hypothetical protein